MLKNLAIIAVAASLLACGSPGGMDAGTGGGAAGGTAAGTGGGEGGGAAGGTGGGTGGGEAGGSGGGSATGGGGASDTTPPQVISSVPSTGSMNVGLATPIRVVFSEPMAINTVSAALSPSIPLGSPSWNPEQTQLSLSPVVTLPLNTTFTLTVSGSDAAGNSLSPVSITFRTLAASDTTAPTVTSTTPAGASTGVGITAPVVITFSESMRINSVMVTGSPAVTFGTPAWTMNDSVVTLAPNPALAASTTYTLSVTGSDLAGNNLASAHTFTFTTGALPDMTPPTLVSSTPDAGATNVASTTRLVLTFSEAMNTSGVTVTSSPVINLGVPSWSNGDRTVTFQSPVADWALSTSYTLTVAGADVAGNALGATTLAFSTVMLPDTTPPTVQTTTPAPGAMAVSPSTKVRFVFSEPMSTAETQAAITISPATTCTFAWSSGDSVLECTPSAPLAFSTPHTVTVGTGAKDKNNNLLASTFSFSFTTAAAPDTTAPTIASTVPPTLAGAQSPGLVGVMNLSADGGVLFDRITINFSEPMNRASVQGGFTINDNATSTTLTGGTFSWSTDSTQMTYQLPPGAIPMPFGTIVNFSVSAAGTDLAGNPLVALSAAMRYFQLRQRATLDLYSCGASATSTCNAANPSAPSGTILGQENNCTSAPATTQSGVNVGNVGDLVFDDGTIHRTYLTFSLSPLAQRPYDNNLAVISAVAALYQTGCNGAPYNLSQGRVAALYDINYGTTLETSDCGLTPGTSVSLTDSTTAGFKTADVTDIVSAHWAARGTRGFLSQFLLRLSAGPSLNATNDLCTFALWGYPTASLRPYLRTTIEYN